LIGSAASEVNLVKDFIPLFQTVLWILLILFGIFFFRRQLTILAAAIVQRVERGGGLKAGPFELQQLTQDLATVKSELSDLDKRVVQLFLLTMSPYMYANLRKLASGRFGDYEMSKGLEREIRHLRDLGYVTVESVSSIPASGNELLDYVAITPTGKDFVELRDRFAGQRT
jgi:hypothetical protein